MRRILIGFALIASTLLSACATTSSTAPTQTAVNSAVNQQVQNVIAQVQTITTQACKFVPTAETVLNIIGTFTDLTALAPVTAVADSICAAVTQSGTVLGRRSAPTARGVPVHGRFVSGGRARGRRI